MHRSARISGWHDSWIVLAMNREVEKALVEQARSGNPLALNQLLAGCYTKFLATAKAMLGNHEDAHDAAQEAAILVFERIHQLEDSGAFRGWSSMIVRRRRKALAFAQ
jgi:DNA-directed RNA polymerase specialized sigma24 family protein